MTASKKRNRTKLPVKQDRSYGKNSKKFNDAVSKPEAYGSKSKASSFSQIVDRRFAQRNPLMTATEKADKRFALQRKKIYASKTRFNLGDDPEDEELFKQGSANSRKGIKRDDDYEHGELGADLVALANFGGGPFQGVDSSKTYKTKRDEALANLIALSKQKKFARQQDKEDQLEQLASLDDAFVGLRSEGAIKVSSDNRISAASENTYDALFRELHFDNSKCAAEPLPKKHSVTESVPKQDPVEEKPSPTDAESNPEKFKKARPRRKTMKQVLRKETRGAYKALKKEAIQMGRIQNEQRLKVSKDRNEKTKRILHDLQNQESEYKKKTLKKF